MQKSTLSFCSRRRISAFIFLIYSLYRQFMNCYTHFSKEEILRTKVLRMTVKGKVISTSFYNLKKFRTPSIYRFPFTYSLLLLGLPIQLLKLNKLNYPLFMFLYLCKNLYSVPFNNLSKLSLCLIITINPMINAA